MFRHLLSKSESVCIEGERSFVPSDILNLRIARFIGPILFTTTGFRVSVNRSVKLGAILGSNEVLQLGGESVSGRHVSGEDSSVYSMQTIRCFCYLYLQVKLTWMSSCLEEMAC